MTTQVQRILWHELLRVASRETARQFGNQLYIRVGEKFERGYYTNAYNTVVQSRNQMQSKSSINRGATIFGRLQWCNDINIPAVIASEL